MSTTYSTRNEAIQREIIEAIEAGGNASATDFDVEAIANAVLDTTTVGSGPRYFCAVDTDTFWEIVAQHDTTDNA